MNIIDPLMSGDASLLYSAPGGVLIREKESGVYMMSADNQADGNAMLGLVSKCNTFVCHQKAFVPAAQEKLGLHQVLDCVAAAYMGASPARYDELYAIRTLTLDQLETVRAYYHNVDSNAYIAGRIASGQLWGAFIGETLMGFIGRHEEKSIGMLEVLPQYRRRRVGAELEGFLINRLLSQGRVPFCQVFPDNAASVQLQKSVGMTVSQAHMYWLC